MLGFKLFYFIPNLNSDVMTIKSDYVIATEFDNTDNTFKVRFLNGDAVQMWATHDDESVLEKRFQMFLDYKKVYWECREAVRVHEDRLKAKYKELFGDWMDIGFGQIIEDRHNPEKVLAKAEKGEENALEANVQ